MTAKILKTLFGSANDRFIRGLKPTVEKINALEPSLVALSDAQLAEKTNEFRRRLGAGESLDALLPEAFATVREAAKRALGMRHFDVQLMGGMILHKGMIAEMKTGEGKTLVCTLAAYLNALPANGVHVVTVNDYLAQRDAQWMGRLYKFLGLSVGCIVHGLDDDERRAQYACDITYATNNELGFDYLRDNMKFTREAMVHRPFAYAVVDEVDSILIDEARTPLIISGPTEDNSELYYKVNALMRHLTPEHYEKDEKQKSVSLTEAGVVALETQLVATGMMVEGSSLYDIGNVSLVHHVNQALKAHVIFTRDVDYIVKDAKVMIIDEFTGRMMEGRRYSDGLHQALEAKENVPVQNENQTLASITFQNYFRMYPKLAGMTGTAMTEAGEFRDIYKLETMEVPTHQPVTRQDFDDEVYRTADEKHAAAITLIKECHAKGQPVLVGTISIEKSEYLSKLLKKEKIPHQVLNARYHEQEAYIIAQAGRAGAVTIATNMAGRGTDIMLGGNAEMMIKEAQAKLAADKNAKASIVDEMRIRAQVAQEKEVVLQAGGLFVVATERHESRRIDNQLRGRSGRQGDPGASKFFISLEDDLMRIFGATEMISKLMGRNFPAGEPLVHPMMTRTMERAQKKVEARNYEIRKHLLKFDDVMNDQRKGIFSQRIELMEAHDVSEAITEMRADVLEGMVSAHIPAKAYAEAWDALGLEKEVFRVFGLHVPVQAWAKEEGIADDEIKERLKKLTDEQMLQKESQFGAELMRMGEKRVLLSTLDQVWKDHLLSLDHLRHGINLRAYGQRDPLSEYKQEAFAYFEAMMRYLRELVTERMAHLNITVEPMEMQAPRRNITESRVDPALANEQGAQVLPMQTEFTRVGRNDPCPCGSSKKFKFCHGQLR